DFTRSVRWFSSSFDVSEIIGTKSMHARPQAFAETRRCGFDEPLHTALEHRFALAASHGDVAPALKEHVTQRSLERFDLLEHIFRSERGRVKPHSAADVIAAQLRDREAARLQHCSNRNTASLVEIWRERHAADLGCLIEEFRSRFGQT